MSTYLDMLKNNGVDAQSNLFYAKFIDLPKTIADDPGPYASGLSVRLDGFTAPVAKQETYTVNYGPAYIERPKAFINITRSFPLKFRIDSNYTLYKVLQNIYSNNSIPSIAEASNSINNGFIVEIYRYHGDFHPSETNSLVGVRMYRFSNCWISSLSGPNFKTGEAGPLTVEATINFVEMQEDFTDKGLSEQTITPDTE